MHIRTLQPVCLLLCLLGTLVATSAEAQFRPPRPTPPGENFHVELGLMLWKPTPGIIIGSDALAVVSDAGVDFVNEFNIADKKFNEFRGVLKGGKNKLRVSHVDIVYNESARLQRAIVFGGRTFNVSADATADLEWDMWRIGYERDLVATSRGLFGFITEVNFNHVVANVKATDALTTVSSLTDEKVPVPAVGVIGRVYPHKNVSITAEFTGFKMPGFLAAKLFDRDDADAHIKDFDIYLTGSITRFLGIQGGYRSLSADYLIDDGNGDLEMKGPYIGGMIRF
jgi:hypothetical protein